MKIEALDASRHKRSAFSCGVASLDNFLATQANQDQKRDISRTYVMCEESGHIAAYYTLCFQAVTPADIPRGLGVGPYDVPAVLLGRLAVDSTRQGEGHGKTMLLDAFLRAAAASEMVGARLFVVDALGEPEAEFYQAVAGLKPFDSQPLRLYLSMDTVRVTLAAAGLASTPVR